MDTRLFCLNRSKHHHVIGIIRDCGGKRHAENHKKDNIEQNNKNDLQDHGDQRRHAVGFRAFRALVTFDQEHDQPQNGDEETGDPQPDGRLIDLDRLCRRECAAAFQADGCIDIARVAAVLAVFHGGTARGVGAVQRCGVINGGVLCRCGLQRRAANGAECIGITDSVVAVRTSFHIVHLAEIFYRHCSIRRENCQ